MNERSRKVLEQSLLIGGILCLWWSVPNQVFNLFVSIGQKLAKDITSDVNPMSYMNSIEHNIVITHITCTEVGEVTVKIKNKKRLNVLFHSVQYYFLLHIWTISAMY